MKERNLLVYIEVSLFHLNSLLVQWYP